MYRSVVVQRTSPFKKSPRNLNRAQTAALRYHSALSTMLQNKRRNQHIPQQCSYYGLKGIDCTVLSEVAPDRI